MKTANYSSSKALPVINMGDNLADSLELQIIEDPLNDVFNVYDEEERKKQIDAFTAMMRETSKNKTSTEPTVHPSPYLDRPGTSNQPEKNSSEGEMQGVQGATDAEKWEKIFSLEEERYLTVAKFRGNHRIHIRDFFRDRTGVLKPTKRGIALTPKQWRKIKLLITSVDQLLYGEDTTN